jgi:uridine phosphorylase
MSVWQRSGVLASEMESAVMFVIASLRDVRAGAILAVVNATEESIDTGQVTKLSLEPLIETVIEGVRRLIKSDRAG